MSSLVDDDSTDESEDLDDDMCDDNDDGIMDLDDASHLLSSFNSNPSTGKSDINVVPQVETYPSHTIRPAFSVSSRSTVAPSSIFGDSINSYIEGPSLFEPKTNLSPYYLSIDPNMNQSDLNQLGSNKLFVCNIAYVATSRDVKTFFINLEYNVIRVDLPNNQQKTGHAGYGFVQLDSADSVERAVYHFASTPEKFVFKGRKLKINHYKRSRQPSRATLAEQSADNNAPSAVNFDITNVHYGTFIVGAAMDKITGANSVNDYGLIAHRLVNNEDNTRFRLRIDTQKREISIIVSYKSLSMSGPTVSLAFTWPFNTLKGEKISPVLINDSQVGLLVELKRAPVILYASSHNLVDATNEMRQPGTPLIGRANAWFFQLTNNSKVTYDYMKLFQILRRYNLSPPRFVEHNILRLIYPFKAARENLRHVQVLSHDRWIKENRDRVDHFLTYRWPKYPFETKFEMMKLLSKHIITINDLIIDEQLDRILAQCSMNTFITCSGKIMEFAPRWLYETCDNEDEDWGEEEQAQITEDQAAGSNTIENISSDVHNFSPIFLQSATGASIDASNTELIFPSNNIGRLIVTAHKQHFGYLSRFLRLALRQLQKKHELRKTAIDGVYVTKHELHSDNSNSSLIRKVYITPSTILYEGPYQEEQCLVTRRYANVHDGFLRVSFRDEDYRKLQSTGAEMSKLYDRMKAILIDGIGICDRQYDFLAFSSSQLREHCCWMFSSMKRISANSIRRWMGDFTNIHPVAKMAARLGQSFSTTKKGIELQSRQYKEISDVRADTVCFTDGIGIITPWLVEKLCKQLRINDDLYRPCAFQIRFGGWKGMVCLDVASQIPNSDMGLYIRPSMNKFDSKNKSIDIVRVSSMPSAGFLNRQIILLLSSLGIDDDIFFQMQEEMLSHLNTITVDHQRTREFLNHFGGSSGNGYHAFLLEYLKRFGRQIDPFVRQILMAFQAFMVKELRTKARILLPNTWSLFGVADETQTLKYGEVFIQIEQKSTSGDIVSKIITGSVVVTRNPCFHPGDIRRLKAIDVPALHQLKNVIVFPMDGPRSHPAEMSGGDLDGDTFWISHEQRLLFNENEEPFDYHDQATEDAERIELSTDTVYTINDVCNFFAEYIEADNLGVIANSHLAFADQSPSRAKDIKCLKLARMHSTAVDFAKNGVSAPRLTSDLRPAKYPHFMENKFKAEYHSQTILGQLYDEVKQFEISLSRNQQQNIENTSSFPYDILIVEESNLYITAASTTKNAYDFELKRVMRQYGIQSEAQLVSGYILKFTSKQYAKQAKMFDLRNEISHAVKIIQDKYLRIFYEEIYDRAMHEQELIDETSWLEASKKLTWNNQLHWFSLYNQNEITASSEVVKKASAWFYVTYKWLNNQTKEKRNRKRKNQKVNNHQQISQRLLSFAWIVYPILMKIYDDKTKIE